MAYEQALSTLGNVTANTRAKAISVMDHCQATLGRTPGVLWGMGSGSEHGTGRAIDFMTSQNGRGLDDELGDCIANYLLAHGTEFGLAWIIWKQRIYPGGGSFVAYAGYNANPNGGWRPMEDRGSTTKNHYDHVHAMFGVDTAIKSGSVVKNPSASGTVYFPAYPFDPNGWHRFGDINGPAVVHGGDPRFDDVAIRACISAIQLWLCINKFADVPQGQWSAWCDGKYEQPTIDAVKKMQAELLPGTTYPGEVWSDDYEFMRTHNPL